jgi:uncharacterized protein YdeI (YjbR/CyaY-like superfamily)
LAQLAVDAVVARVYSSGVATVKKSTVRPAGVRDARVDAYIAKAKPFAQPILHELRDRVHEGAPGVEETIKWSMPFFVYRGIILGNMAAFKEHCSLGLWGRETAEALRAEGATTGGAMGSFGRITSLDDLMPRKKMIAAIRTAATLIDDGERTKSIERPANRVAKPPMEVPAELAAALSKNKAAQKTFEAFPPSCKREYIDWVAQAKREETRASRVQQAVLMMAEGKRRHWKYESC